MGGELYLDLVDRVLLDQKISIDERRALDGMAASLGLGTADVAALNRAYMLGVVEAECADDAFMPSERALVIQLAGLPDLVVWPGGVKKGVAAVIAHDPGSNSGKARKAREYGIPVVGDGEFRI